jgi:N-acetylglucosaminyl-diphospho-decaprenol L-rhamnosyltransferase
MGDDSGVKLSYCVVNTNGREYLRACLEAIEAQVGIPGEHEVLVLDNASTDGSVAALEELEAGAAAMRVIYLQTPEGKAANDTRLLQEARGEYCLLLNEDSELLPGAAAALVAALDADPGAAAAGAQLLSPDGEPQPCAWRLPGVGTALAQALLLHRLLITQSRGPETRRVGWAQSAALLVRRAAVEAVGWLDPDFFVYSDETDLCKRLGDSGRHTLYVPAAAAVHHEQLSSDRSSGRRRIVEFHRNRDLYMRKHHGAAAAFAVRALTAFSYLPRAAAAVLLPGHDARHYLLHASQALHPHGEGLREAAAARGGE